MIEGVLTHGGCQAAAGAVQLVEARLHRLHFALSFDRVCSSACHDLTSLLDACD